MNTRRAHAISASGIRWRPRNTASGCEPGGGGLVEYTTCVCPLCKREPVAVAKHCGVCPRGFLVLKYDLRMSPLQVGAGGGCKTLRGLPERVLRVEYTTCSLCKRDPVAALKHIERV